LFGCLSLSLSLRLFVTSSVSALSKSKHVVDKRLKRLNPKP